MAVQEKAPSRTHVIRIIDRPDPDDDYVYPPYQVVKKPSERCDGDKVIFRTVNGAKATITMANSSVFGTKTIDLSKTETRSGRTIYETNPLPVKDNATLGEVTFGARCEGSAKSAIGHSPPGMIVEDDEP